MRLRADEAEDFSLIADTFIKLCNLSIHLNLTDNHNIESQ